jgi:hypothetical protein
MMSNTRKLRQTHSADRRNEWLGIIYVYPDVVGALAPADCAAEDVQPAVNAMLRPVFDRHYEAGWPNIGPVPYTSLYATVLDGVPLNIELATWPGERTDVRLSAESPAQRRRRIPQHALVVTDDLDEPRTS